jgi:hypothetical protein
VSKSYCLQSGEFRPWTVYRLWSKWIWAWPCIRWAGVPSPRGFPPRSVTGRWSQRFVWTRPQRSIGGREGHYIKWSIVNHIIPLSRHWTRGVKYEISWINEKENFSSPKVKERVDTWYTCTWENKSYRMVNLRRCYLGEKWQVGHEKDWKNMPTVRK